MHMPCRRAGGNVKSILKKKKPPLHLDSASSIDVHPSSYSVDYYGWVYMCTFQPCLAGHMYKRGAGMIAGFSMLPGYAARIQYCVRTLEHTTTRTHPRANTMNPCGQPPRPYLSRDRWLGLNTTKHSTENLRSAATGSAEIHAPRFSLLESSHSTVGTQTRELCTMAVIPFLSEPCGCSFPARLIRVLHATFFFFLSLCFLVSTNLPILRSISREMT
jgi:hypothetical protein